MQCPGGPGQGNTGVGEILTPGAGQRDMLTSVAEPGVVGVERIRLERTGIA
jgi:hypothetical protein